MVEHGFQNINPVDYRLFWLFALGAFVMRSAGCIVNDIWDRNLDKKVKRTKNRPIASGKIKVWQALALLAVLLCIGYFILNEPLTAAFGVAAVLVTAGLYLVNRPAPRATDPLLKLPKT